MTDQKTDIPAILVELAKSYYLDISIYKASLKKEVEAFDKSLITHLPDYFFADQILPPDEIAKQTAGLGVWMDTRQNIIFDLLYELGEKSIPVLYPIAFGEYDWTQYKAIRILCLFAKDGIQTEKIIQDISDKLPDFRYEAIMPALWYLSSLQGNTLAIKTIEHCFDPEDDIADAIYILECLANCDLNYTKKYAEFLSDAMNLDLSERHPILDGAIVSIDANGNESINQNGVLPAEIHQINAASLLYRLYPDFPDVRKKISYWGQHHPEQQIREKLQELLATKSDG